MITYVKMINAVKKMKFGKVTGSSEVNIEMIIASGKIGVKVLMELCLRVLDGKGIPGEWQTSFVVPIYKRRGDVMSCGSYGGIKLLKHAMKIVEKRLRDIVNLNELKFGFMPKKSKVYGLFALKRKEEEL